MELCSEIENAALSHPVLTTQLCHPSLSKRVRPKLLNYPMAPLPRTTPAAELYSRTFFSRTPSVQQAHRSIFPNLILPLFYNAFLMWGCLSLFYGSLLKFDDVSKINVAIVNSDDGFLGQGIVDGIEKSLKGPGPHLRWKFENEVGGIKGGEMSKELVLNEKAWAVLQGKLHLTLPLLFY